MSYLKLEIKPCRDDTAPARFNVKIQVHSPSRPNIVISFKADSIGELAGEFSKRGLRREGKEVEAVLEGGAAYLAERFDFPDEFLSDFED
jgi:hypothetical protein